MKARDIVIGFVVLVLIVCAILVYKNSKKIPPVITSPNPNYQQVEQKFPSLKVPTNADRISLNSISGGTETGEAFRTFENGTFSLTIIADVPTPPTGESYKGYLENGNAQIFLGDLVNEKGGYLVNFTSNQDLASYRQVVVTLGPVRILEGSF